MGADSSCADQTVAAFAARLNDTVHLDSDRDDLAGSVHRTLKPAYVSMWLSPQAGRQTSVTEPI